MLLHGWIASGGINWYQVFGPASEHFRVVAPDLRGHGRGVRSRKRFTLADCADDVAMLLDELEIPSAIMVGYSMGGPVAELLWKRHQRKVEGLVLCATSHSFVPGMRARLTFTTMMAAAAGTTRAGQLFTLLPRSIAKQIAPVNTRGRPDTLQRWAAAEMGRHDWRMILEAGSAIGHFDASRWIDRVDVPTADGDGAGGTARTPSPGMPVRRTDDTKSTLARNTLAVLPCKAMPIPDPRELRNALGAFLTGVTVVTTRTAAGERRDRAGGEGPP